MNSKTTVNVGKLKKVLSHYLSRRQIEDVVGSIDRPDDPLLSREEVERVLGKPTEILERWIRWHLLRIFPRTGINQGYGYLESDVRALIEGEKKLILRINLTPHHVYWTTRAPLIGIKLPDGARLLAKTVSAAIRGMPEYVALKNGIKAEVALPNNGGAAAVILTAWYGLFGKLPRVRWAVRNGTVLDWPNHAKLDLQAVRTESREMRKDVR